MNKRSIYKQMEYNNTLSPDVITATLKVQTESDAEMIHFLYEEFVEDLPELFEKFSWARSLKYPAELYLIFPNKRKYGKFMRKLATELPKVEIIAKY